jgi:hypothetical protein
MKSPYKNSGKLMMNIEKMIGLEKANRFNPAL